MIFRALISFVNPHVITLVLIPRILAEYCLDCDRVVCLVAMSTTTLSDSYNNTSNLLTAHFSLTGGEVGVAYLVGAAPFFPTFNGSPVRVGVY